MEGERKVTEALLREDLDSSIEYLEAALACFGEPMPPEALECLLVDACFGFAWLFYSADPTELRELIGRLRSLREGLAERFAEPSAPELARAIVELDPIAARFPEGGGWKGVMGRICRDRRLDSFGDPPDPGPGPRRGQAERRAQDHVAAPPAGSAGGQPAEAPSEAAERRGA